MNRSQRGALDLAVVVGLTVLGLALTALLGIVLPVSDAALGSEAAGTARAYTQQQLDGRALSIREGCFTCHTRFVRDAEADASLGPLSQAGDYGNEAPSLLGLDRIGPDLTCVGDRESDQARIVKHLRHPRSVHAGSSMPSYAFLSGRELRALAAYLSSLTCREVAK